MPSLVDTPFSLGLIDTKITPHFIGLTGIEATHPSLGLKRTEVMFPLLNTPVLPGLTGPLNEPHFYR